MQIVKYNPFRELQKMEKDFSNLWGNGRGMPTITESSVMDMYEEDGKLIAEVSLPNFKKEEIKISSDDGVLEISAEHKEETEEKSKRRYYFRETNNQYLRRVVLPEGANGDESAASFKDGILKVSMPMVAQKPEKTIAIQ